MQIGDAIASLVLQFRYIIKPSGETIRLLWLLTLIHAQIFSCDEFYNSLLLMSFGCFEQFGAIPIKFRKKSALISGQLKG
ncbi:hypothetical protein [Nostoc sp. NMS1]|uniref:hypothetical protein n=1 Tax=Nostoc sp. NMS1 TaxID=2815388 RepID=UPI0025DD6D18|nr:hypothetical protein [Nostoc sp. NMS1]